MKILQEDSQRRSFAITSTIFVVLLLLIFFWKLPKVEEQPILTGGEIAISFGNSKTGSGKVQPKEIIETTPEVAKPEPKKTQEVQEVVTQNTVETPVVKTPTTKPVEKVVQPEPVVKPEPKPDPKPSQSTTDALASLINGPKQTGKPEQGQGQSNTTGDQGALHGDMYSNSTYGSGQGQTSGGGASWGLNGRSLSSRGQVIPDCNEVGTVVVEIRVDQSGRVISAQHTKGTTNSAKCLTDAAIATAKTFRWKPDQKAPSTQIGFIVINFRVGA
ncbi:energy transducer TonB [Myroides sp. LJL115]